MRHPSNQTIGLYSRQMKALDPSFLDAIITTIQNVGCSIVACEKINTHPRFTIQPLEEMVGSCDLILSIGGDGTLLDVAQTAIGRTVAVLGIHKGTIGFLTDLTAQNMNLELTKILIGKGKIEPRRVLIARYHTSQSRICRAFNEVLVKATTQSLLQLDCWVDDVWVCHYRADGLILATASGSTAYALSAGGAIVHPQLESISLVPLNPHNLSSRAVILPCKSQVRLKLTCAKAIAELYTDGRQVDRLDHGSELTISYETDAVHLAHPEQYNFFNALTSKLHWEHKPYAQTP